MTNRLTRMPLLLPSILALAGCSGAADTGTVEVRLEAEDTLVGGLAAGTGDEAIVDGWNVTFDQYVLAIGDVRLEGGPGTGPWREPEIVAVDLTEASATDRPLARFEGVRAGAWPTFGYGLGVVTASTTRDPSVPQADFDRMVAEGCTYLIRGTLAPATGAGRRCVRGDATQCTDVTEIAFDLCVPAAVTFGPCQTDTGTAGLTVTAGLTTSATATLHGDHLFFNGFPEGAEGVVARRAQWLANADVDADGLVTRTDLEAIGASDLGALLPSTFADGMPGFSLGGAPRPLNTAWDYVGAQLVTQGHFGGEGECPWTLP